MSSKDRGANGLTAEVFAFGKALAGTGSGSVIECITANLADAGDRPDPRKTSLTKDPIFGYTSL